MLKKAKRLIRCIANSNLITIYLSWVKTVHYLRVNLTRSKFEELSDSLIRRTMEPTRQAMKDAGLTNSDIDEVILVGGSTRIPTKYKKLSKRNR